MNTNWSVGYEYRPNPELLRVMEQLWGDKRTIRVVTRYVRGLADTHIVTVWSSWKAVPFPTVQFNVSDEMIHSAEYNGVRDDVLGECFKEARKALRRIEQEDDEQEEP